MTPNPILDKLAMFMSKVWVKEDTIIKATDEATQAMQSKASAPAITVTKVAVTETPSEDTKYDISKISDQDIDKMTIEEAKDFIKKARDYENADDSKEGEIEKPIGLVKRMNKFSL